MTRKPTTKLLSVILSLALMLSLLPGMSLTALAWDGDPYAALLNNTTAVNFDGKEWYLIENNSTAANAGTVTLLSKECVAASKYDSNGQSNTYSGSTVETAVNNYYTNSISGNVKAAIVDSKMFLLTTEQANTIKNANPEVLKCNQASGADENVWWLCSPGDDANYAACVLANLGSVYGDGEPVYYTLGVRPALKLNLSSVIFSSESKTFTVGSATVDVTGVSLDKTTVQTIDLDGKVSFTATVEPNDATDKTVKWSVGGTDAGAVKLYTDEACTTEVGTDATETLTVYAKGESAGSATITATSNADSTKSAICAVTVNPAIYTVTWKFDENTVIDTTEVEEGTTPTHDAPTKEADAQYNYTFSGWTDGTNTYGVSDALPAVTGDTEYTATFTSTVNHYTITWKNGDDVLETNDVAAGTTPEYNSEIPTKEADYYNTYEFSGWTDGTNTVASGDAFPAIFGDVTYTAVFTPTALTWTANLNAGEGSGEMVSTDVDRSKSFTLPEHIFTAPRYNLLSGWLSSADDQVYQPGAAVTLTEDTTFTAQWTLGHSYMYDFEKYLPVGWQKGDRWYDIYQGDYYIFPAHSGRFNLCFFYSGYGYTSDLLTSAYEMSGAESATLGFWYTNRSWNGDTDQLVVSYRAGDGEWVQLFATDGNHESWTHLVIDLPPEALAENVQFRFRAKGNYGYGIAIDDLELNVFGNTRTVTWINEDGSLIETEDVPYDEVPAHEPLTKERDDQYNYTFTVWTDGTNTYGVNDTLPAVTGSVTYTAVYSKEERYVEVEEMINALPETNDVAVSDKDKIKAARDAYNDLTDEQKEKIDADKLAKLTDETAPLVVEEIINDLGQIDTTDECAQKLKEARAAYDALTDNLKKLVSNENTLEYAEKLLDALEAKESADEAAKAAEDKAKAAEEAKESADEVAAEAQAAKESADEAAKAAEDRAKAAEDAQKAAEDAQKTAEDAQKVAEDAQKTAEDAQKAAEDAQKAAEDAQKTAEDRAKVAEGAQKAAEDAQKTAEDRAKAAEDAQKAAEDAQKTAEDMAKETKELADEAVKAAEDAAKEAKESADEAAKAAEDKAKAAEEAAKAAEDKAKAAEEAKESADEAAAAAQAAQATAEAAQAEAEAAQAVAEARAQAAEDAQATAEAAQATAEDAQKAAEDKAQAAEDAQKAAEDKAQAAKDAQKAAEDAAKEAKDAKESADEAAKAAQAEADAAKAAQQTTEDKTKAAKDAQKAAEDKAKAAEEAQKAAEEKVKAAEDAQKAAEEKVKAAEDAQKAAEDKAKAAEEAQKAAEDKAKAAEEAQKAAEDKAKDTKESADEAVKAAEDAAKEAKESADEAVKTAEDAKESADEAAKAAEDSATAAEDKAKAAEEAQKAAEDKAKAAEDAQKAAVEKAVQETTDRLTSQGTAILISSLPTLGNVTAADKTAIANARAAYNALTAAQKALIDAETLKKLTDAEAALAALEADSDKILGDVNGDGVVDSADALLLLRASVGLADLSDEQKTSADVNGDGEADSADALDILRYSVQLSANEKIGKPVTKAA